MLSQLKSELEQLSNPSKAKIQSSFFKTSKGQYSEGDIFLGVTVPETRKIANKYLNLQLTEIQQLLSSKIHDHRLIGLLILVENYKKTKDEKIPKFYLQNLKQVNNWDLVDLSADKILGQYLLDKDKSILYKLAQSNNLWERRVAIISTFQFIKNNQFEDTLKISEILLNDKHDLIHKAVGWMLRELGKRNQELEEQFLKKHYKTMPRTMLRYAIEKFDGEKRKQYLSKNSQL